MRAVVREVRRVSEGGGRDWAAMAVWSWCLMLIPVGSVILFWVLMDVALSEGLQIEMR